MKDLFEILARDPAVGALNQRRQGLSALDENSESLVLTAAFRAEPRMMVVVKPNLYTAQQLYRRLTPLLPDDVLLFSVEESLRVEEYASTPTMYADQMETLARLTMEEKPRLIVTHPAALIRWLPSPDTFRDHVLKIRVGDTINMETLKRLLTESGYRRADRVDQPLTYSWRGDVVDVFSIQYDHPVRIEFFDDVIDSVRFFSLQDQRTVEKVEEATIVPASMLIYSEDMDDVEAAIRRQLARDLPSCGFPDDLQENVERDIGYLRAHLFEHYLYRYRCFFSDTATFLEYVPQAQIVLSTGEEVREDLSRVRGETADYVREIYQAGKGLLYFSLYADWERMIEKYDVYSIGRFQDMAHPVATEIRSAYFPSLPLDKALDAIAQRKQQGETVILAVNEGTRMMIDEALRQRTYRDDLAEFMPELFEEGFQFHELTVLTARELFGTVIRKGRYTNKFNEAQQLDDYQQLQPGDYVVHNRYGIGQYVGVVTREIKGIHKDYLRILYRDGDELLVPLEQFRLVRKYIGSEGVGVRLSKLGSSTWAKNKEKIQKDVAEVAARLMDLYAARQQAIGFAFAPDDENTRAFEANFEFELTPDQKKAIAEVKADMESPRPMDRLLCGDVGFGKTEVAMVAAFKAVNSGKQVAYLCPTTILSHQHYDTFSQRFKGFPVKIALINRFVPPEQQKQILKAVSEGKIDILIGTHRLLSRDVKFEDLGLLIIDEEQRFGVEAKEQIKELKRTIDVLSLSATPIPRTLQMSLIGVMSLSQIDTPPKNRLPIQTYVVERNDSLIKEVIQRELARKGQVYFLHNNVATIYETAAKLETQLPHARIGVAHGKMSREEIEDVMYEFILGRYDVLVCTTIIETGIDISNVNTILIDRADTFGLSQLYQIRGRVGRSDRIAYAYLMHEPRRQMSETAAKRLQAIKDFTQLGSGYKIAMRDLTIRGAGDLLGERQAGFINTVGMDLYLDLLQEAINRQKGLPVEPEEAGETRKVGEVDGYIPEQFAPQDYEKITLYQRIDKVKDLHALLELQAEITDRYGRLPNQVKLLFEKKRAEVLLNTDAFAEFRELPRECRLTLSESCSAAVDGVALFQRITELSGEIKLRYKDRKITLIFPKHKKWLNQVTRAMEIVDAARRKEPA